MNAQAINYPQGRYNPGGVLDLYYAFVEDILSMPALANPETALTYASLVEYTAPIIMKEGKQFFKHYQTMEEGEVKCTLVGPIDGKGFENNFEFSFPGNSSEALGFQAALANRAIVAIVKEKNGVLRVIGSLEDPAYMQSLEGSSGKKVADGRKTVMTVKASAATPAPIYTVAMASILTAAEA